jgi:cyclopropane-fatty-acyl-phospholipid synthase
MSSKSKNIVADLLSLADVKINGHRPWDIQVHDDRFYSRVLSGGSLALGESYVDGWWDSEAIDQLFYHVLNAELDKKVTGFKNVLWLGIKAMILNRQGEKRAYNIGEKHYDIGNDLYQAMLDKRMNYSCAYWSNSTELDDAQESKLELCCKKLGLKPGLSVLDIGCGWGAFAKYAAVKYGVRVTGITVSKEQVALAKHMCEGLSVDIRLQDYRSLDGQFDSVVSMGMIEHVGYKKYRTFMKIVNKSLADDGLFLLHTIGSNISDISGDPWMDKYIFPDGMFPSAAYLTKAIEGLFVLEDWHNFGIHYDKTLMAWHSNFVRNWEKIRQNTKYDKRFYRMWTYYLLSCAGAFRVRRSQLWQIVLSKKGVPGGYKSVR